MRLRKEGNVVIVYIEKRINLILFPKKEKFSDVIMEVIRIIELGKMRDVIELILFTKTIIK